MASAPDITERPASESTHSDRFCVTFLPTIQAMEFTISPTPIPEVIVSRFDQTRYPKFRSVFEPPVADTLMKIVAQPPEEATGAVVIENGSEKDITALRYRWIMTLDARDVRASTVSSDSYRADVYRPVLKRQDRMLVSVIIRVFRRALSTMHSVAEEGSAAVVAGDVFLLA